MSRLTHLALKKQLLANPEVKAEYDALEEEFNLLEELIKARHAANKTQAEIAKAMRTTTSAVGRLETGGGKYKHSPSIGTLRRYANAINCRLQITLIPKNRS